MNIENYQQNPKIMQKLQEIIDKSEESKEPKKRLSAQSLYNNIYNSTGTVTKLKEIFEVPENIIQGIKQ